MTSFKRERKPMFARVARVNGEVRTFEEMPIYSTLPDGTRYKIETINDLAVYFMLCHGATEEEFVRALAILYTVSNKERFIRWCASNKKATVEEMLSKCIELREEYEAKKIAGTLQTTMGTITWIEKKFCKPTEVPFAGHLFQLVAVNGVPVRHNVVRKNKDGSFTTLDEKTSAEVERGVSRLVRGER